MYRFVNTFFLILSALLFAGCAKDNKLVEANSSVCQSLMLKNQYIVHWKKKNPTLLVSENLKPFLLDHFDDIKFVEPNYNVVAKFVNVMEEPITPSAITNAEIASAVYETIHVKSAWYRGYFGQGLTVAVVDTGVDQKHPSLRRRLVPGWNFISDSSVLDDETGHGTAMAGIITGPYRNSSSLSLAPDVKIMPIDFMTEHGGTEYHAQQALDYAISHNAKIINNSWTVSCSELLRSSFVAWSNKDVIFINSSGNEPVDVVTHGILPASLSLKNHLQVGSLDDRGRKSTFSGFGDTVQVYAPGELVPSFAKSNMSLKSIRISGTSASTAIVSAAAAILWSAFPKATASEIVTLILEGALVEFTIEPTLNVEASLKIGRQRFSN